MQRMEGLMKLARITTYPVKSISGMDLAAAQVTRWGLEGDRRWAVVYPSGVVATRRELPRLALVSAVPTPHGISLSFEGERLDVPLPERAPVSVKVFSSQIDGVQDAGNFAAHFLSCALETEVRMVYFPDDAQRRVDPRYATDPHFTALADGFPILLTTTASLDALNAALEHPVEMRRFRANLVVAGDFEPWAEDSWRVLRIGRTVMRVVKPCERCVMTTQDPSTGERRHGNEPLATLRRLHRSDRGKIIFGQNVIVEDPGEVVLGDDVEILESGPSNLLTPDV